ncbi:MAG TPA: TPM domain-containing protein [Cyclobacteriaceae bacterium]|nr:TPM domain-containing protein [Cyclobacteriaceae bacterium]
MKFFTPTVIKSIVVLVAVTFSVIAYGQKKIPDQAGRLVHDEAHVLSANDIAMLEYTLRAEQDSSSNQIAVLIVTSLEGDEIASYANRVFNAWKLGTAKKDNGVLFLIAIEDRQMRIEPGAGLEGVLTDVQSSRINRNQVAPHFRQGDYAGGIKAAVVGIIQSIKGEYTNDEPIKRRSKKPTSWVSLLVILVFIIIASRRGGGGKGGYMSRGGWILPMGGLGGGGGGGGFGGSSGSWGGGGFSGGGGSSDSW